MRSSEIGSIYTNTYNSDYTGAIARTNAAYGQGSGPIFFEDVRCTGLEYRVFDCPSRGIEVTSCSHSEDAGVICVAGNNFILIILI